MSVPALQHPKAPHNQRFKIGKIVRSLRRNSWWLKFRQGA